MAIFACPIDGAIEGVLGTACGRIGRNHPADRYDRGMANSLQPQSRQT
jgi:hypothetical protein